MKKHQLDHILRAAGDITGQKKFVMVGSQALHGKYPDLADDIMMSAEVDLFAPKKPDATELLNEIGVDSPFHLNYGFYADPIDEGTATLPKGWKGRLVNLPAGDTGGVQGLCLEPHDLAIAKYVARRSKARIFTAELARRGLVGRERLLDLVELTPVTPEEKERIRADIANDFASPDKPATDNRRPAILATVQFLSCRAMNSLTVVRALSVCGPGSATHSWVESANRR